MPATANAGEQHKDNITKYLESNKDKIIDLAEKNYQNLVEALTNNSINTVVVSLNPTLSLPQSQSSFLDLSNQGDICKIEKSKITHNSKDDIDD